MRVHLILVVAVVAAGCHGGTPAAPSDPSAGGSSTANIRWEPVTPATTTISLTPPAAPSMPDGPAVPPFSAGGWTWEAPAPFGYEIADVWATSATDVIAAPRQRISGQAALLG